jgi:hypothetical protein
MFIMMFSVNSYAGKGLFARLFGCCGGVDDVDDVDERPPVLNSDTKTHDFGSFKQYTPDSYEINPLHSGLSTIEHKPIPSVVKSEPIPSIESKPITPVEPSTIVVQNHIAPPVVSTVCEKTFTSGSMDSPSHDNRPKPKRKRR